MAKKIKTDLVRPPSAAMVLRFDTTVAMIKHSVKDAFNAMMRTGYGLKMLNTETEPGGGPLYSARYSTFEQCVKAELGMTRDYAYKLIRAYDVLDEMVKAGVNPADLPTNEQHARELGKIEDGGLRALVYVYAHLLAKDAKQKVTVNLIQLVGREAGFGETDSGDQAAKLLKTFRRIETELHTSIAFGSLSKENLVELTATLKRIADKVLALLTGANEALKATREDPTAVAEIEEVFGVETEEQLTVEATQELSSRDRYLEIAKANLPEGVRHVEKNGRLAGIAFTKSDYFEAPKPTTLRRLQIYLHEVGHMVLHRSGNKPRYVEEFEAEKFSHDKMRESGLTIPREMMTRSRRWVAFRLGMAIRRGLENIDPDVKEFTRGHLSLKTGALTTD